MGIQNLLAVDGVKDGCLPIPEKNIQTDPAKLFALLAASQSNFDMATDGKSKEQRELKLLPAFNNRELSAAQKETLKQAQTRLTGHLMTH